MKKDDDRIIRYAAKVLYKDGKNCSEKEVKSLVVFIEKLFEKIKGKDFNYDYDYYTAVEYLADLFKLIK